jgi:hypothetical protein
MFIAMIDLSRTFGTAASLICYVLVIFMIYPWIKIKLKVLIFPTKVTFEPTLLHFESKVPPFDSFHQAISLSPQLSSINLIGIL